MPKNVTDKETKEVFQTTQKLNRSLYETYRTAVRSAFDVQGHTARYVRDVLIDSIETLENHADASQRWLQTANTPQNQQELIPSFVETGIEAYKRNVAFMQKVFEQGVKTFEHNADVMRDLTQKLLRKAQEQQEMWEHQNT